jgi:outer membrane protein
MKLVSTLLATSIAVLGSSHVMAYEAGDIMIKAGVINVTPKDDNLKGRSSALNADVTVQASSRC